MAGVAGRVSDRVLLDVFANRFQAVAEEMAHIIQRTGFTVYVKESLDYAASFVKADGQTMAFSQRMGTSLTQRSIKEALDAAAPYNQGDIVIANDSITTGGLCTHLPDVYLWKPVFSQGELLGFFCCFIHATDVGGRVAGSVSPTNSEIYQEGLRIPPVKLYRRGELNEDILKLYLTNCRIPDQNWGDLKALIAAMNTAEERVQQMVDRYGLETVRTAMEDVLAYAEESARHAIKTIPDGDYHFVDLVDDDMVSGRPIRIELTMKVRDDEIIFDFTGTDYEVRSALNVPIYGKMNQFMTRPFAMYMHSINPSCPINGGVYRPLSMVAEEGSVFHPGPTAAVGVRMATVIRAQDAMFGALAQATSGVIPAAASGAVSIPLCSVPDFSSRGTKVSQVSPMTGGSGARPNKDGIEGRGLNNGSMLMNVPAERLEIDMPVIVRAFGLVPDSGAPGRYRGGCQVKLDFETLSPGTIVTARGMERFRFRPWGLAGGMPGSRGNTILHVGTDHEQPLGKIDILHLDPGVRIRVVTPCGGGYGDPLERDPAAVLRDIRRGLVSVKAAGEAYGVVVREGQVDDGQTMRLREQMVQGRTRPMFDFGPERQAFDALWPEAAHRAFHAVLTDLPPRMRPYISQLLYKRLERQSGDARPVTTEEIAAAWSALQGMLHFSREASTH